MDKKLPSIFKSETNKKIENNKKVFYSKYESVDNGVGSSNKLVEDNNTEVSSFSESLDNLLKNNQFIFNVPVEITLKDEIINTKLVSKVGDHLLTNTGKVIQLDDVLLIRIKQI